MLALLTAPKEFMWLHHPLDVLGAQNLDFAWIYNSGMILFGVFLILISTLIHHKYEFPQAMTYAMVGFGMSAILMAIWKSENIFYLSQLNLEEHHSHEQFSHLAILSITICIGIHALLAKDQYLRKVHFIACFLVISSYSSFLLFDDYQGLSQLVLWMVILLWIPLFYGRLNQHANIHQL